MNKSFFYLILSLLVINSPAFAQRTQPDPNPVTLNVSVENTLFSPVVNSSKSAVFKPRVENAKKIRLWFLTIRNSENNKKTREFIQPKAPVPESIVWDGLTSDLSPAPDGQYSYKFFVLTDRGSHVVEKTNVITIDSTPPFVSLKCDQDVCFVNLEDGSFNRNLVIYLSAGDENGINYSKSYLEVLSYNDKRVKIFPFNAKIPEFVIWDGVDDVYNMPLPIGNYKVSFVVVDKAGNTAQIDSEISIAPMPKEPELPKEVEVKEEERGLVINLSSKVLFDVAKSELKTEAEKALTEVSEILNVYSKNKVLIEGHTDSSGNNEKNMQLSIDRAQSVFDFFVNQGIDESRMQVYGFGSDKPVASNSTDKGKEQNRRVEIVILKTEEPVIETNQETDAETIEEFGNVSDEDMEVYEESEFNDKQEEDVQITESYEADQVKIEKKLF